MVIKITVKPYTKALSQNLRFSVGNSQIKLIKGLLSGIPDSAWLDKELQFVAAKDAWYLLVFFVCYIHQALGHKF